MDYHKISFLKKNIADLEDDKVEDCSLLLGKILKWVRLALEVRIDDVVNRRDTVEYIKQDREQSKKAALDRQKKYDTELADKRAAFEESVEKQQDEELDENGQPNAAAPAFDEREFNIEFDIANPEV